MTLIEQIEALIKQLPDQPKRCCYHCQNSFTNKSLYPSCHLADWHEHFLPEDRDPQVDAWIKDNQRANGTVFPGSLGCPRFEMADSMYPPPDKVFRVWDR